MAECTKGKDSLDFDITYTPHKNRGKLRVTRGLLLEGGEVCVEGHEEEWLNGTWVAEENLGYNTFGVWRKT